MQCRERQVRNAFYVRRLLDSGCVCSQAKRHEVQQRVAQDQQQLVLVEEKCPRSDRKVTVSGLTHDHSSGRWIRPGQRLLVSPEQAQIWPIRKLQMIPESRPDDLKL